MQPRNNKKIVPLKKDLISLAEAANYCSYTQDYLSLRARQGKLKAIKQGRNWYTTKDWLGEYEGYIALAEAANHSSYTQDYLSLRARQGKLKAIKLGRNWVTKKEWVKEYEKENLEYKAEVKDGLWEPVTPESNSFDKLLKEVDLFNSKKIKVGYYAFTGILQNLFSDFSSYFSNLNVKQSISDGKLPKLKFSNYYSLNQFVRSLNFSVILLLLFISLRTLTPIAFGYYDRNEGDIKKSLSLMSDKILTSYINTFKNISTNLIYFDEGLKEQYKKIPKHIELAKGSFENDLSLVNDLADQQLILFDIFEEDRFDFSGISETGLNILAYSDASKVLSHYDNLVKPYPSKILGVQEFGFEIDTSLVFEDQNLEKNIFSFKNILNKINFYREIPNRFSKSISYKSQSINLAFWESVLSAFKDILQVGETRYVYKDGDELNQTIVQNYYTTDGVVGLTGAQGPQGLIGPAGTQGPTGAQGPQGPPGSGTTIVQGGDAYLDGNNTWTNTNIFTAQVLMQDLGVSRYLGSRYLSVADALSVQSDEEGGMIVNADATFNDIVAFNSNVNLASGINFSGDLNLIGNQLISGDLSISGALYDNSNSVGADGYVLQSTGSGFNWVSTSTLGFGGGSVSLWNQSGDDIYYSTGKVGIGTSTPSVLFHVGSSTPSSIAIGSYYNSAYVSGDLEIDGATYLDSILNVSGLATFDTGIISSSSTIIGDLVVGANVTTTGDQYIGGDLTVIGSINGTLSGNINPGFVEGSIVFQGASGFEEDGDNLFWDDTANLLAIGHKATITAATGNIATIGTIQSDSGFIVGGETVSDWTGNGIILSGGALTHATGNGYEHIPTAGATTQMLQYNAAGVAKWITLSGDVIIADGGVVTIQPDSVALGADTTGDYILNIVAGNAITVTNGIGEGATTNIEVTLNSIGADELAVTDNGTSGQVLTSNADGTFSWADVATSGRDFVVGGTLVVTGTTTLQDDLYIGGQATITAATGDIATAGIITALGGNSTNWNDAYNWGDHSSVGYLTVETDPIWSSASTSLTVSNFASANISQWTNDAGYITSAYATTTLENYLTLTDWYATSTDALDEGSVNQYFTDARSRASISETIQGITYDSGTGVFSLDGLYSIPLTASSTYWTTYSDIVSLNYANWNDAYNWGDHSSVGYLTVETDPIWSSASTSLTVSNFASAN
ncbi:MAG: collagen-like protein, partial [Burkholderiales bacterium]|nr:collagen-like protein [Burkholderiales bacterium]